MDLSIENGGSFHSFLYVYQRVGTKEYQPISECDGNLSDFLGEWILFELHSRSQVGHRS